MDYSEIELVSYLMDGNSIRYEYGDNGIEIKKVDIIYHKEQSLILYRRNDSKNQNAYRITKKGLESLKDKIRKDFYSNHVNVLCGYELDIINSSLRDKLAI